MTSPSDRAVSEVSAGKNRAQVHYGRFNSGFYCWCFAVGVVLGIWLAQR